MISALQQLEVEETINLGETIHFRLLLNVVGILNMIYWAGTHKLQSLIAARSSVSWEGFKNLLHECAELQSGT